MSKIFVGFSTPKKFHTFPWFIKLVEGTEFSHTYIRIRSENLDRDLIYQASGLYVNFSNMRIFLEKNNVIQEFEADISPETYKKVLQFAIDNNGLPYSLKQTIGILWNRVLARFGICKKGNFIPDGKKGFICTELVTDILEECLGIDIKEESDSVGLRECYFYAQKLNKEHINV